MDILLSYYVHLSKGWLKSKVKKVEQSWTKTWTRYMSRIVKLYTALTKSQIFRGTQLMMMLLPILVPNQTYFLCCFASARKCCMGVLCGNRAAESPGWDFNWFVGMQLYWRAYQINFFLDSLGKRSRLQKIRWQLFGELINNGQYDFFRQNFGN